MGGIDRENAGTNAPVERKEERHSFGKNLRRFFRLKELGIAIPMVLIFVIIEGQREVRTPELLHPPLDALYLF